MPSATPTCRSIQKADDERIAVLLVVSELGYGGAERQAVTIANDLDETRFDAHICSLSAHVPLSTHLRDVGRRLHIINKKWKYDFSVVWRLARLLTRLRIAVGQAFLFDSEIALRLAGAVAKLPLVIGSERNSDYRLRRLRRLFLLATRNLVDLVIANSNAGASFNQRLLNEDPSKYRVVHNGVDTRLFRPRDPRKIRSELGLEDSGYYVGMFASFKRQKNHRVLLEAATRVVARLPEVRFVFVGDEIHEGYEGSDRYKGEVRRLVRELKLDGVCHFLGTRTDAHRVYSACDVTVLPSLHEGTPNVVLESMACGVPVIVTDIADNRFLVKDGEVGFVVPVGDHEVLATRIAALLQNQSMRTRMGRRARHWICERFSTEQMVANMARIYESELARKRAP